MSTMPENETTPSLNHQLGGKFLTFKLGDEEYGIEIKRVHEIIGIQAITAVPLMESHVRGIFNLRDRVIPVIDLRIRFSMPKTEDTSKTCIIVVEVADGDSQNNRIGLVVDEVAEVLEIPEQSIQYEIGATHGLNSHCLAGLGVVDEEVKMLLEIDQLVTPGEVARISRMTEAGLT